MTPDDIRDELRLSFPMLIPVERNSPDGWSFFYERETPGARIITATRSSGAARTRLLRAASDREGAESGYEPFLGGPVHLRKIVGAEVARYLAAAPRHDSAVEG